MTKLAEEERIFRAGSQTYYWSSLFFPAAVRDDVFRLYSFVRVVDNYVDELPQKLQALDEIKQAWKARDYAILKDSTASLVAKNIIDLSQKYNFDPKWVDSFLWSMSQDAIPDVVYKTQADSLAYVYGSAEVIGLMMAKIIIKDFDEEVAKTAMLQGRAMQWINFCRDIDEDNSLGRCYFPACDLKKHGLQDLSAKEAKEKPKQFASFLKQQLDTYEKWQAQAAEGWRYLPWRCRIPVITASNMYTWTAQELRLRPEVIFERQLKPSKQRILAAVARASVVGV